MTKKVRIDIVSDVVCPWCIVGYKRFEKALTLLEDSVDVDLHWHPFELNPQMPEGGENLRAHLAKKYGTTLEDSIAARKRITDFGAEHGFTFNYYDEQRMYNTFKAHQLIHWAKTQGKETEMKLQLFAEFFSNQQAVDQIDVLVKAAEAVGLDGAEAREVLQDGRYADAVREAEQLWLSRGIQGVPAFVINERYLISGAQPPEMFAKQLSQIMQEAA